jgi:hypothetical protein
MRQAIGGLLLLARKQQSGFGHLVALQDYPAALVMCGYAMGLTKGGRLSTLYKLLDTEILIGREVFKYGIEISPLQIQGACSRHWRSFPGYQQSGTPFADRLVNEHFSKWAPDFSSSGSSDHLYDVFELCSLLYSLAHENSAMLLKSLHEHRQASDLIEGRLHWNKGSRLRVLHALSQEAFRDTLLEGRFAHEDDDFLNIFIEILESKG